MRLEIEVTRQMFWLEINDVDIVLSRRPTPNYPLITVMVDGRIFKWWNWLGIGLEVALLLRAQ